MKKIKRTPQGTPIVPKDFHEWYEEIKDRWGRDSEDSAHFALWKICQLGFGYGLEDALNRKLPAHSGSLTRWVSYHKSEAVESIIDGYEVEESKWVVKNEKGYVAMENFKDFNICQVGVRLSIVDKKSEGSAWDDADLKKAEALAVLVDGSVEEA